MFISFDYDHDATLKEFLVGQAKNEHSPFFVEDWSIKKASKGWKADARGRIQRCDVVIVICGLHTHQAVGVAEEVRIAREESVRLHLLRGYPEGWVRRPQGTSFLWDELNAWTWDNVCAMTTGNPRSWLAKLW